MVTMNIQLKSVDTVRNFVKEVTNMDGRFDLISDRYIVDAKSLLSIFYLDLTRPMQLKIDTPYAGNVDRLRNYEIP